MKNKIFISIVYFIGIFGLVPWYWAEDESRAFMGVPIWALISLLFALFLSILTAGILINLARKSA
jgi:hypothetical protein